MKVFKFIFNVTKEESSKIFNGLSQDKIDFMKKLYFNMEYTEFLDENGFEGLFCIVDEETFNIICTFFSDLKIKFSCENLSEKVLLGKKIKTDHSDENGWSEEKTIELLEKFYKEHASSDSILDKINESGIESLTEFDKEFLAKGV
jgi:hypothetical protein